MNNTYPHDLEKYIDLQSMDEECCFLCGNHLNKSASAEHVFPRWLQREYDLWNKRLNLLNDTRIPYRSLTIPCCENCNNNHLSRLETEIKRAVMAGYKGAVSIPDDKWYLWAGKIFYGILRKEISLPLDRTNPEIGTILPPSALKSYSNLHRFLQRIRGLHEFTGGKPYTVLLVNLHDLDSKYDFRDQIFGFTLAFKLGEIGLIVSFEDGGQSQQQFGPFIDEVAGRKLHPIQFLEMYARISYETKRRTDTCNFFSIFNSDSLHTQTTMVSNFSELEDFNTEELVARMRSQLADWMDVERIVYSSPSGETTSFLTNSDGEPLLLSAEEWPK